MHLGSVAFQVAFGFGLRNHHCVFSELNRPFFGAMLSRFQLNWMVIGIVDAGFSSILGDWITVT